MDINLCPECGVPEAITRDNVWLNSGVMVQSTDTTRRVGFIESENLDPVYRGIESIIGAPIDRLVLDTVRKGTVEYIKNITPPEVRGMIHSGQLPVGIMADALITNGKLNGFGAYELVDLQIAGESTDSMTLRIAEPFSVLICAGIHAGTCEAISDRPYEVTYRELSPGLFESRAYISEHPEELEQRLDMKPYRHRDGDVGLERCPTCGGPSALSGFKWLLDRGIVMNSYNNKRMTLIGPEVQDPLFEELEKELGDTIPMVVIEAQRRFVKSGFYSIGELSNEGDIRSQLALRGLGNLREITMVSNGLRLRVDNVAGYLMTVGMAQGLFEMAFDVVSNVEWEISEEGDLQVQVTPSARRQTVKV